MFLLLLVLGIFLISFAIVIIGQELKMNRYKNRVYTRNLRHED